jgi:hypothetical protein
VLQFSEDWYWHLTAFPLGLIDSTMAAAAPRQGGFDQALLKIERYSNQGTLPWTQDSTSSQTEGDST